MDVTAQLWSMVSGETTELKYKDQVFVLKPNNPDNLSIIEIYDKLPSSEPIYTPPPKKPHTRNIKISYLEKWIKNNNFEVFTLDMFFHKYPKQRRNKRLEDHIRSLLNRKIISQFNKPSGEVRFRVNRR